MPRLEQIREILAGKLDHKLERVLQVTAVVSPSPDLNFLEWLYAAHDAGMFENESEWEAVIGTYRATLLNIFRGKRGKRHARTTV